MFFSPCFSLSPQWHASNPSLYFYFSLTRFTSSKYFSAQSVSQSQSHFWYRDFWNWDLIPPAQEVFFLILILIFCIDLFWEWEMRKTVKSKMNFFKIIKMPTYTSTLSPSECRNSHFSFSKKHYGKNENEKWENGESLPANFASSMFCIIRAAFSRFPFPFSHREFLKPGNGTDR